MTGRVRVDGDRLRAAAASVGRLADGVGRPVSAAVLALVSAADDLAGSAFAGSASAVVDLTAPVTGDLVRALRELGLGMTTAAERYAWVDGQAAAAFAARTVLAAPTPLRGPR